MLKQILSVFSKSGNAARANSGKELTAEELADIRQAELEATARMAAELAEMEVRAQQAREDLARKQMRKLF